MLNDRRTHALDLLSKPNPQAGNSGLVIADDTLHLSLGFGEELQNEAHRLGAICRMRAKTSPAGIG